MERSPTSVNLRKIKINDIKTVIFFSIFEVVYISADNKIIISQAHEGVPYRNPSLFDQVMPYRKPRSFDQVMGF